MSVRYAKSKDLDEIMAIDDEVLQTNWNERLYLDEIVNPGSDFWILDLDSVIIGYIILKKSPFDAEILQFAVSSKFQKQGFGSILIEKTLDNLNSECVFLEVSQDNESALSFYRKYDFDVLFVRKSYYGPGEDAFVMRKRLK